MENYKYVLFQNLLKEAYDERCYGVYDGKTIVVQGCSLRQKFLCAACIANGLKI